MEKSEKAQKEINELLLSERLRELRLFYGKKMREVASFLDASVSTYAGYEAHPDSSNNRIPSLDKLINLSIYYGVSIDYLVGKTDYKYSAKSKNIFEEISTDSNLDPATKQFLLSSLTRYSENENLKTASV